MASIRRPAVAGTFYPGSAAELRAHVERAIQDAGPHQCAPKALIAPHAGYVYSGAVAGFAYAQLALLSKTVSRAVLLGPAHTIAFRGIAVSGADRFLTPLGEVHVDGATREALVAAIDSVVISDAPHAREHSIEVQLPFLQVALPSCTILPLVVGAASPATVRAVLDFVWGGSETLVVVSSDLSHYETYERARLLDDGTTNAILSLDPAGIRERSACGGSAIAGLLLAARDHGLRPVLLDQRSSGDTAGPRDRVVGYGAYAFVA